MRTASAGLIAYLNATTATPPMAHLVTVTPRTGSVVRWTDWDTDLVVGGNTYYHGGEGTTHPVVKVGGCEIVAGTERGTLDLVLLCGTGATFNGTRVPLAAVQGDLRGATVKVQRLYPSTSGGWHDALDWFEGPLGESPNVSESRVELEVESVIGALNVMLPRNIFQPQCRHMVYDSGCGLTKATFTVTGTVSAGATTTTVPTSRTEVTDYFILGVIEFTSGALNGVKRGVRAYSATGGTFTMDQPLDSAPASGVTFSVYPGCKRTKAWCENNSTSNGPAFNNVTKFSAEPFVPRNEAGT